MSAQTSCGGARPRVALMGHVSLIAIDLDRAGTKAYQPLNQSLTIVNYPLRHRRRAGAKMRDSDSRLNANERRRWICDYLVDRRARSSELTRTLMALLELDLSSAEVAPTDTPSPALEAPLYVPTLAAAGLVRVQLSEIEQLEAR